MEKSARDGSNVGKSTVHESPASIKHVCDQLVTVYCDQLYARRQAHVFYVVQVYRLE